MNFHNIIVMAVFVLGIIFFSHGSFAQSGVPVIDATETNQTDSTSTQSLNGTNDDNSMSHHSITDSSESRQQLSQQIQNIANMNLPQQINDLQQKVQKLQGQLQVQQHNLELLNIQQRSFYEDLNQRINQMNALASDESNANYSMPAIQKNTNKKVATPTQANEKTNDVNTYQNAFQLIMQKHYSNAENAFKQYLAQYPTGNYADSAHYWLGEIYLLQNQLSAAIQEFQAVINQYKTSNKIADAKLKLATIHLQQGKKNLAIHEMQQVKQNYPNSTAAQLATIQLQQLNKTDSTTTNS